MVTREQIVGAARKYVGLPFSPQLRSAGLLLAVAERLGLPDMNKDSLRPKFRAALSPGDIVVLRAKGLYLCNGIITEHKGDLCVVRPENGFIVEHILDDRWRRRIVQVFEVPGLDAIASAS